MAPAASLFLRMSPSVRLQRGGLRTSPAAGSEYAASPGEASLTPRIVERGDVHALGRGLDHPVRRERDPDVVDAGLGRLAVERRLAEEEEVAGSDLFEVQPLALW